MWEFLQHNWELFFGFASGGGLLSFLTAKWTKMTAQANAMKEWQGVYQETITDLRGDKELLKIEISDLRIIVQKNRRRRNFHRAFRKKYVFIRFKGGYLSQVPL